MSGFTKLWLSLTGAAVFATATCLPLPGAAVDDTVEVAAARQWPAGDRLFRQDARWRGGDAALSIPLSQDRTLWLFGDSFIAPGERNRIAATMVRNSIAIQEGSDPRSASLSFYWGEVGGGGPGSFFPEDGERWYWPGHGLRLSEGPLVVFLYSMVATPGRDLGFATAGYAVAVIDNPDAPPEDWQPRIFAAPAAAFDAVPATAVVREGPYVVAVAIRQRGVHAGALVRYPAVEVASGRLDGAQWWAGEARGWVAETALGPAGPVFALDDAGAECSLHRDERNGLYVHVASYGFGDTDIGIRTAPALTGPWTPARVVYRPPESDSPHPFVYAAKAHPGLAGAGMLLVTYVASSWEFDDLLTPQGEANLYWPRFVAVPLP